MTTKFVNSVKSVFIFCFALFSIIACEKDFRDVGVSLVDNNLFNTKDSIFEVIAYSKEVDSSRVDLLPQRLLGVYNDPNFGLINANFVSQLGLPSTGIDFGENPIIDEVILDIPYYATRETENNTDGSPNFSLDSIIGDQDLEYTLKVQRLRTFLNTLDPLDPTKAKIYYSDEDYTIESELYSGNFKPNNNDTVLYVQRNFLDSIQIDTIKKESLIPSIKLPLNKTEIENIFINNISDADSDSFQNFSSYFRGILIEASGTNGSLMTLAMSDATFSIYYTNEIPTIEAATTPAVDLNGDGDTLDTVNIKTKQTMSLPLFGISTSVYNRNYSTASVESDIQNQFNSPNKVEGHNKLYVQGSAGSIAEFEISIDLDNIRAKNWLINGAILDVYVDQDVADNDNVPAQLYIYNVDENSIIPDVITEGQVNGIGGFLERNDENEPVKYQFSITDYLSELLKPDDTRDVAKLAIKTYHSTDAPISIIDTIVKNFSWIPKGVVLKGNNLPLLTDGSKDNTRFKLVIYYTEDND